MEDFILKEAGYEPDGAAKKVDVHSNASKSLVQTGDIHRGVGGRDSAGSVHDSGRATSGIQGPGDDGYVEDTPVYHQTVEARGGLQSGGCPWVIEAKEYKYPDAKVTLAIPSGGEWKSATGVSSILLVNDFMQYGLPGLRTRSVHVNSTESSMLVNNRHNAVKTTLKHGATHLLFVDSDMRFPPWALRRLLSHDVPIVAANCTKRAFPVTGTALGFDGADLDSRGKKGLEAVRQVGAAFMLIRRDVLEKLRPPLFLMDWVDELNGYCGEDIYFSQLVQAAGFEMLVDHELSMYIGHVGSFTFGHNQIGHEVPPWMPETAAVVAQ